MKTTGHVWRFPILGYTRGGVRVIPDTEIEVRCKSCGKVPMDAGAQCGDQKRKETR